jgi:dienelactone hydrolase
MYKFFLTLLLLMITINHPVSAQQKINIAVNDAAGSIVGWWFPVTQALQPTVISLHGCGGPYNASSTLLSTHRNDAQRYNKLGWNWLVLDSFSSRGIKGICEIVNNQRTVTVKVRANDLGAAITWLTSQAAVDPKTIAVLGRSHGAQTVIEALNHKQHQLFALPLAAGIALYPGCTATVRDQNYVLDTALLILVGALDNWTPPEPCEKLYQRTRINQPDQTIQFESYPESYHGFDTTNPVRERLNLPNASAGKAMTGGNPTSKAAAEAKIEHFLTAQFARARAK